MIAKDFAYTILFLNGIVSLFVCFLFVGNLLGGRLSVSVLVLSAIYGGGFLHWRSQKANKSYRSRALIQLATLFAIVPIGFLMLVLQLP